MKRQQTTDRARTIGYCRVSTPGQADEGVSLGAQRAKIEQYAALYDLDLVEVITDAGLSAKTLDRPGLQRALAMLRKGQADALLVAKLDRLTRSTRDLGTLVEEELSRGRWALLSVAEQLDTRSASGRLVLNILGSVASWERDVISERTRESLAHKRSQRKRTSRFAPYGFTYGPDQDTLVADPAEQAMLRVIGESRQAGLSQRATLRVLAEQGYGTRQGTPLRLSQLQRLMAYHSIA